MSRSELAYPVTVITKMAGTGTDDSLGVFDPNKKIKTEDTSSDDEVTNQGPKIEYKNLIKNIIIEVEPLNKSQIAKCITPAKRTVQPKKLTPSEVKKVLPKAKPALKRRVQSLMSSPTDSGLQESPKPIPKKAAIVSSLGLNSERSLSSLGKKRKSEKCSESNLTSFLMQRTTKYQSNSNGTGITSVPGQKHQPPSSTKLMPNDLRYFIGSRVAQVEPLSGVQPYTEESPDLQDDAAESDDFDSMSIHAEDDDLFDNASQKEDLNKLGKHFESLNNSGESEKQDTPQGRRRSNKSDEDFGKMQQHKTSVARSFSAPDTSAVRQSQVCKQRQSSSQGSDGRNELQKSRPSPPPSAVNNPKARTEPLASANRLVDGTAGAGRRPTVPNSKPKFTNNQNRRRSGNGGGRGFSMRPRLSGPSGPRCFVPPLNGIRPQNFSNVLVPPRPLNPMGGSFHDHPNRHHEVPMFEERPTNQMLRPCRQSWMPNFNPGMNNNWIPSAHVGGSSATDERLQHLLNQCCKEKNFENCLSICQDIIRRNESIGIRNLEALMYQARDDASNLNTEVVMFLLAQIRKNRMDCRLKQDDYFYAIEALLSLDDVNSAVALVLEMKQNDLKPRIKDLKSIRNGIFALSSVDNTDRLIDFCDLLDLHGLASERIVEECLKHVTAQEMMQKTSSRQVLQMIEKISKRKHEAETSLLIGNSPIFKDLTEMLTMKIDQVSASQDPPAELVKKLIESVETCENAVLVINKLSRMPKNVICAVDSSAWNDFLRKACDGPFADPQIANQVQGIMVNQGIPVDNTASLRLVCRFHEAQFHNEALEAAKNVDVGDLADVDLSEDVLECLMRLMALPSAENINSHYNIILILIRMGKMPSDDKLKDIVGSLRDLSRHQEIYDLINKLKGANLKPSSETFKMALSALEDWGENPGAFIDLYSTMRQYYPKTRILSGAKATDNPTEMKPQAQNNTIDRPKPVLQEALVANWSSQPEEAIPVVNPFRELMSKLGTVQPQASVPAATNFVRTPSTNSEDAEVTSKADSGYISNESVSCTVSTPSRPTSRGSLHEKQLLDRLALASKSNDIQGICKIYVDLRHANIAVDDWSLRQIFEAITRGNPVEKLRQLMDAVRINVMVTHLISDEDDDATDYPQTAFRDEDQQHLGRLAVKLLFDLTEKERLEDAFDLLCLLHESQVNYALFGNSFDENPNRTSCQISMTALNVCLLLDPPNLDDAMVVFRDTDHGTPMSVEDEVVRASVLSSLTESLLFAGEYEKADEVLSEMDVSLTEFLNLLLLRLSEENNVDCACHVYEFMDSKVDVPKQPRSFRAYLNCLAECTRIKEAKQLFEVGRMLEIYPSQEGTDPYFLELPCTLTTFEMLLMVEEHLRRIQKAVFDKQGHIKSPLASTKVLKIVFKPNYELYETAREQVESARGKMATVLKEWMKPPLKIVETENPDEPLVVGVSSIIAWYNKTGLIENQVSISSESLESHPVVRSVHIQHNGPPTVTIQPRIAATAPTSADTIANAYNPTEADTDLKINGVSLKGEIATHMFDKVREYDAQGKVENFQECCMAILKTFIKHCKKNGIDLSGDIEEPAIAFVDNFFEYHGVFRLKKQTL